MDRGHYKLQNKICHWTVYRHPQQKFQTFEAAFIRNLKLCKAYKKYVVMGDFNIDYNCYDTNANVKKYAHEITCLECEQMVVSPTRISPNRQSILDHIYIKNSVHNEIISVGVIQFDISDRHPTIVKLKSKTQRKDIARPMVRKILTNKIENFVEELDKNLQKHFRDDLTHKNIDELINSVKTVTDNIFPKTRVSRKQFKIAKNPWITKDFLKALKRQNKLYSKYLKSKKESDYQIYRTFRNKVTRNERDFQSKPLPKPRGKR